MNETIIIVAVMCNVDRALPTPTSLSPSAVDLKIYNCQKKTCAITHYSNTCTKIFYWTTTYIGKYISFVP